MLKKNTLYLIFVFTYKLELIKKLKYGRFLWFMPILNLVKPIVLSVGSLDNRLNDCPMNLVYLLKIVWT